MDSGDLAVVEVLLKLGVGDAGRLNYIKSRLQDGKKLYDSDKKYIERLKDRYVQDGPKDYTPQEPPSAAPADTKQDKNVAIINRAPQPSAAWYLAPMFLGIIGGIIAYFAVRHTDPRKAKWCIIIGALVTIIPVAILAAVVSDSYLEGSTEGDVMQASPVIDVATVRNDDAKPAVGARDDGRTVQVDYEQYPQTCLDLEDKFWDKYGDFAQCALNASDPQECMGMSQPADELISCIKQHGQDSPLCRDLETMKDVAGLVSCMEQQSEIMQKCKDVTEERFLPDTLEVRECVAVHGLDIERCGENLTHPFEEVSVFVTCMEQHGMTTRYATALSYFVGAFEEHQRAVDRVFPDVVQDTYHNFGPVASVIGSCDSAMHIADEYYSDLYWALDPDVDYNELSDDEFFDILAQKTIDRYGLHTTLFEDVREHVIAYENMVRALDDFLTVRGCQTG